MKYFLLALPLTLLATQAMGQQIEFSGRVNANFLRFGGANAVSTSTVNYDNTTGAESSRTTNPYGKKYGVGVGASVRAQRVAKVGLLTALDLGYDWMQSRTPITYIYYNSAASNYGRSASGTTHLRTPCLTAFGGVGWRLAGQKLTLDALVGPELAYVLSAHEQGSGASDINGGWNTDLARNRANSLDFRLRGELTVWRGRVGLSASYAYGFTNYEPGTAAVASPEAYVHLARAGLAYRLK